MGDREFIDSLGVVWKVGNRVPLAGAMLTAEMKSGWLTFESMTCRLRRLTPVPDDWEQLPTEQLEQLCAQASEVRPVALAAGITGDAEPNDEARAGNPNNLTH